MQNRHFIRRRTPALVPLEKSATAQSGTAVPIDNLDVQGDHHVT